MPGTLRSFRVLVTLTLSIACSILVVVWPGWLTDLRAQGYSSITKVSGDNQSGAPNTALANPFVVLVTQDGKAAPGQLVTWTVLTPGGGTLSATSTQTGANGQAQTTLTFGPNTGPVTVRAAINIVNGSSGTPVTFTATATAVIGINKVSGDNQTGVINAALRNPFVVSATLQNGAPVENTTVTWSIVSGGGNLSFVTTTTDSKGQTQNNFTLGSTPGAVTVKASTRDSFVFFTVNDATPAAVAGLKHFSVMGNVALSTATVQATNIGLRLSALRGGATGMSAAGLSINIDGQSLPLNAAISSLGNGGGASADPSGPFGGLGIFLNGQGSFGDQRATTREPGFDFHTAGLTLGSDYRFTKNLVLGAAFGYLKTKADLDASAGHVTTNGRSVSAYGTYHVSDKVYLDGIATYGWNTYDSTRNVPDVGESAKGNTDGNQFALSVNGGYDFNFGALTVGPSLRVNYIRVHIDGFQERGADLFNLRVESQKVESLATALGGQLSYAISMPWGVLLPLARFDWEHEYRGGSRLITGSLVADPLRTSFSVPTNNPDRNYFNLGAGLTATLKQGASAFFYYETVLGRDNVTNHSFTAGVRFAFE